MSLTVGAGRSLLRRPFHPAQIGGLSLWLDASQGLLSDGAAQFTAANSEYLSIADNAALSMGDIDFLVFAWIYLDSLEANRYVIAKGDANAATTSEFLLFVSNTNIVTGRIGNGAAFETVTASTFGALSSGVWYAVAFWHDSVANTLNIQINNGTVDTTSTSIGSQDTANPLEIGRAPVLNSLYWNGRIDGVAICKSPVGGITALATTIRDGLYNGGLGRRYRTLSAAEKTAWGLVEYWDLDEVSGTRTGQHAASVLVDNNTCTSNPGVVSTSAGDGDIVTTWQDRSGRGFHASQAITTRRPILKTGIVNGKPVVRLDGLSQFLSVNSIAALLTGSDIPYTLVAVMKAAAAADTDVFTLGAAASDNPIHSFRPHTAAAVMFSFRRDTAGGTGSVTGATGAGTTAFRVFSARFSGTTLLLGLDGTPDVDTAQDAGTAGFDLATIGALNRGIAGPSEWFSGDIAAMFLYTRRLSDSELKRFERWAGRQYGIAVAA